MQIALGLRDDLCYFESMMRKTPQTKTLPFSMPLVLRFGFVPGFTNRHFDETQIQLLVQLTRMSTRTETMAEQKHYYHRRL